MPTLTARGAYVLRQFGEGRDVTLIATGTEVALAVEAAQHIGAPGGQVLGPRLQPQLRHVLPRQRQERGRISVSTRMGSRLPTARCPPDSAGATETLEVGSAVALQPVRVAIAATTATSRPPGFRIADRPVTRITPGGGVRGLSPITLPRYRR